MSSPHRLVRSAGLLLKDSCGCCGCGACLLNDIDQKVKDIRLLNGFSDIFFLQGSSFVQLTVIPRPDTQIQNKQFTRLGKQDGRFGTNHADIFVRFHDPLDAGQRQIIVRLEIVFGLLFQTGNVLQGLMPKGIEGMIELRQKLRRGRRQLGQAIFAQQNGFATIRGGRCGRRRGRRGGQGRGHGPRGCGTDDQGCRGGDRQGSIGGHDARRCRSRSRSGGRGCGWHGRVGSHRRWSGHGSTRRRGCTRCGRCRCCRCGCRWCIGFENAGLNLGLGMGMDQGLGLQLNLRLQLRRSIAALRGIFVAGMDNRLGLDLGQGGNLRRIHGLQSTPTTLGRCHDG